MRGIARVLGLFALLWVTGCVVAQRLGAPLQERAIYREARVAPTLEQRLAAAHEYLDDYPEGRWADELRSWLVEADAGYFARIRDNLPALRGYLSILPAGTRGREISVRIEELEHAAAVAAQQEAVWEHRAIELDCELDRAEQQRNALVEQFQRFLRFAAAIRTWGEPISALDQDFLERWRDEEPPPRCLEQQCTKTLLLPYAIPEQRELSARIAVLDVSIEFAEGGVKRVTVAGPELFSRMAEALEPRPVLPEDPLARVEALALTLQLVQNAIEPKLPGRHCTRPSVSPVLLERRCHGTVARMIASAGPAEDDRIVVESASTIDVTQPRSIPPP